MKGFTRDHKFVPMTDYKKVTRKSRDPKANTQGIKIERKARNGKLDTVPESVLFRVLSAHDIPDDIGHLVWSRTVSLSKYRDRQKSLQRRGKEAKFKLTDEEIEQVTKNEDEKTDAELREGTTRKKRFISDDDLDRKSDLEIDALFKDVEKNWTVRKLNSEDGDHQVLIYTNNKDPEYTYEFHPMDDNETEDENGKELEEPIYHDAWYFFPAKNDKGIPNSPTVMSETSGYTRKDAIKEFKKEFISYDQEFSS